MHRGVNVRVLFVMAAVTAVFGTCVHFLHAYQKRVNASSLARQAQRALAQGELSKSAKYLDRYLAFVPGDTAALAQLGQILDRLADGPVGRFQALQYLEQALRREPERRDLRRRVVSLAIDQYQFRDALNHLKRLLADAPESEKGELEHLAGWCHDALGQPEEAVAAFRRALLHTPGRVSTFTLLAEVLAERLGRLHEAGQVLDTLVAANPQSAEALLARARFLLAGSDRRGASRDLHSAMGLLVERHLFAEADQVARQAAADGLLDQDLARLGAEAARAVGDRQRALELARQAVPQDLRDYRETVWLARFLEGAGRAGEAEALLRAAAEKNPGTVEVWAALVGVLARGQHHEEAQQALADARRKLPPERIDLVLARCLEAAGDLIATEEHYRLALARRPGDVGLLRAAIAFFQRSDQAGKAERYLRTLLDPRTHAPADYVARARRQLAVALAGGGDAGYQEALALLPLHDVSVQDQRARALVIASRPEQRSDALRLFDASLKNQPLSAEEQFMLARLCEEAGQAPRARALIQDLLAIDPDNPQYLAFHIRDLLHHGERDAARSLLNTLERIEPRSLRTQELRTLAN
jgi:tetratricopeptide (TPR) repeat protein